SSDTTGSSTATPSITDTIITTIRDSLVGSSDTTGSSTATPGITGTTAFITTVTNTITAPVTPRASNITGVLAICLSRTQLRIPETNALFVSFAKN
ncbi:MAG: hypothetical protein LBO73_00850, partial [Holosporaceae bacterium]|nr:hypothetical protein [Holosporaceae bacterium]